MLSIGQLAKKANVSNRTLRYYEELGLIVPKTRGENSYRYYDDSHLHRLQTIKMLQESGFALKEIVATLSPALEPGTLITQTGQEMAKKIFEALSMQRERLIERQKEMAQTLNEIQNTIRALQECFGCKISASLEDCAKCSTGPLEVRELSNTYSENAQKLNGKLSGKGPLNHPSAPSADKGRNHDN